MKVTDKDREAYTAAESHEASALLSALRNMHCDRPHPIFGPPCERCLSTVHDALAKALHVTNATARAEEREACAKACVAKHITRDEWDGGRWDEGYTSGVKACEAAIRARGED